MTFPEIFKNFKNHCYIRRKSWSEHVFVQYRYSIPLIRMVKFVNYSVEDIDKSLIDILNNDIKLTAEDLFADDWVDINELYTT